MRECPLCGCTTFYVRDPEDAFEIFTFELSHEGPAFEEELDPEQELFPEREVFCNRCSWHGAYAQILPE